jgi:hypothetical protein
MSTGNSLDMTPQDEEIIKANDATIKDMEVSFHITQKHLKCTHSLSEVCNCKCSDVQLVAEKSCEGIGCYCGMSCMKSICVWCRVLQ